MRECLSVGLTVEAGYNEVRVPDGDGRVKLGDDIVGNFKILKEF